VAPAQQNKSTIVRLRSFVCIADDAPEKRVNMSSPEYYLTVIIAIHDRLYRPQKKPLHGRG
ncbi:hypothetical protein J8352_22805, partial [Escherichia coli]|nr:hypothetical protein [Escherichia coli]